MSRPAGSDRPSRLAGPLPLAGTSAGRQLVGEIAVVSGKGGTGKTSLVASLAVLAADAVIADCDVDAADLHLVLGPRVRTRTDFFSGHDAVVRSADCDGCGICAQLCRFDAIRWPAGEPTPAVDPLKCDGCGVCAHFCPRAAIEMVPRHCGEWFVSETRCGPMVHARLGIAAENSGKLVSTVRAEARRVAAEAGRDLILIDGPPGIGCPVIAAMTGATAVLAVSEPSVSGEHDLDRVLDLADHFGIPAAVCVNRWDVAPDRAESIERRALERGAALAGRVRYDPQVTQAQVLGTTVVEMDSPAAADIRSVWATTCATCTARATTALARTSEASGAVGDVRRAAARTS